VPDKQLKPGVLLSYFSLVVNNLASLFFVPFILRSIGQAQYGLYALIFSVVSYLTVLDFGLSTTITRYVAKYRAESNQKGQANFLALTIMIYFFMAICVLIIGAILYFNLNIIFKDSLTTYEIVIAKKLLAVMVGNLALSLPLNSFQAIMTGYEQFVLPKVLTIVRTIARITILFILLSAGYKILAIAIIDTILNISFLSILMLFVFGKLKVQIRLYVFDKVLITEVFSYSFFVFLNLIGDQFFWNIGQIVLGIIVNSTAVAVFTIGMTFTNYYMQFSSSISNVFLPRATQMAVRNASGKEMTDLLIKTGRVQFIILGFILGGFTLFGKQFILLWAGPDYTNAWLVGLLGMVPFTIPLIQNIGLSILQAKNMHPFRSVILIIAAIVDVIISVMLAKRMGVVGVAFGTAFSLLIGDITIMNLYYHIKVGINIPRFFKEFSRGLVPVVLISIGLGALTLMIPGISIRVFILRCILFSGIYFAAIWFWGMNDYEKGLISGPIVRSWGKFVKSEKPVGLV
jgi:O-antigen/teichoic acid export membrane protein